MHKPKPVTVLAVLMVSAILGMSITLLSEFFYSEAYPGRTDYGFPLAWKQVYGGVDVRVNYVNLLADFIIWTLVIFTLVASVFKFVLGWKPR